MLDNFKYKTSKLLDIFNNFQYKQNCTYLYLDIRDSNKVV